MHRMAAILILFIVVASCSRQEQDPTQTQRIQRVENGLIEFESLAGVFQPDSAQTANPRHMEERMRHYNVPGVSVAVIRDYKLDWAKSYGTMNVGTAAPVTIETIFEAASTSKFVAAVIALSYVERGLIDLDTDVNALLKSWKVPNNEFTVREKVTLRRLLTHRAGLPTTNFDRDETMRYPTLVDVLKGERPALNKPAVPEFVPGTKWQYSNVGYDVIQLLLEDVAGKPFQRIAEEVVFGPLGMNSSTFEYPLDSEKQQHEAMPHDDQGILSEPAMHLTALAHGGLTTTPSDLALFANEIMLSYQGRSQKLLSQKMTRQLLQKDHDLDPRMFGLPVSGGLGVMLLGEGKDLLFAHPGSNLPGLNCWLMGWPERGTAVAVMTNGAKGEVLAMEIISAINREYNK